MGDPSADHPLFTRMVNEGHAMFALASAETPGMPDPDDADRNLIHAAIAAGVLGALAVMKDEDD